ncbi:C40 family peptidase [Cellulophaga sp. Z1A5H]|uniref:C40 family peptidase n=1 Tax=Cellulophaga sp. Z1A5H TaxID=2687291 RepID=UPI0013FD1FA7|nr:C40 family peptidase [Cellulophaga sp. Z1A5H]
MQYGICPLSVVPVRLLPEDTSELISQLLYGDYYKVIDTRKFWSKIRITHDGCEGWVSNLQLKLITEEEYNLITARDNHKYANDLISFVATAENTLIPIVIGSTISNATLLQHTFEGSATKIKSNDKHKLIEAALLYLNAPYLWGGMTPFGIDSAGFTQLVYKINGHNLLRNAGQQATQGEALSFIEESEAGDLAFFDTNEGVINHVGIIMQNNYVIHVSGTVRIDRIDHTGIFNTDSKTYTHKLRVIKKIF